MKKTLLFCILAFALSVSLSAQEEKIDWGPKKNHRGFYEILGQSGGYTFVLHMGNKGFTSNPNVKIFKYDPSKKLEDDYKLEKLIGKDCKLLDVYLDDQMIYALVFNEKNKKRQFVEKLKIKPSTMKVSSRKKVFSYKEEFEYTPKGYLKNTFSTSARTVFRFISEDGNAIAVGSSYRKKTEKIIEKKYVIFDRKNFYEEKNRYDIDLDFNKVSEMISNTHLNEDGSLTILKRHYFNEKYEDSYEDKPDFSFELIRKPLTGEATSVKFKNEKLFLGYGKIIDDQKGNTIFAVPYELEYGAGVVGTAFYKIGPDNNILLETTHKSSALKKKKGKLPKNLRLNEFFITGDNYVVMYQEQTKSVEDYPLKPEERHRRTYDLFKNEKLVIEAYNDQGVHQWSNTLHQKTKQEVTNVCLDFLTHYNDEEIMIFANMHKKNIEDLNHEEPKERELPNDDNVITKITISADGEMKFEPLCEPWKIFIGTGGSKIIDNQMYLIGFQER